MGLFVSMNVQRKIDHSELRRFVRVASLTNRNLPNVDSMCSSNGQLPCQQTTRSTGHVFRKASWFGKTLFISPYRPRIVKYISYFIIRGRANRHASMTLKGQIPAFGLNKNDCATFTHFGVLLIFRWHSLSATLDDAIWRYKSWSTLSQVMVYCLTWPSQYLNQCWLVIKMVPWHLPKSNFITCTEYINPKIQLKLHF